jgi:capsular exopolysaccharide synthesis family protein
MKTTEAKPSGSRSEASKQSLIPWFKGFELKPLFPNTSRDSALQLAAKTLQVKDERDSRIIEISCDSPSAQIAAGFLNTFVQEYINQNVEERWNVYQHTGAWLARAQDELRGKLEKSEEKLNSYARASGLLFISEKDNVAEDRLRQLQAELSKAEAERISTQAQYGIATSSQLGSLPEKLDDGPLRQYMIQLAELRRQLANFSASLTPAHYKVKQVKSQIAELEAIAEKEREAVVKRLRNEYESAMRREKLLASSYSAQTGVVSQQASKAIQYNILKREVDTNRQLYETALQKGKEASMASALRASNARVVDRATPPLLPHQPKPILNAGLGVVGGLFLGVMLALLCERFNRHIRMPNDMPYYLNVRELGVIPAAEVDPEVRALSKRRLPLPLLGPKGSDKCVELVTWNLKPCLMAESYRAVLASILVSGTNKKRPQLILVTSPNPKEGKSTVISNLGIALTEINGRVLLIDADMRNPRLHHVFDTPNTWGLSDLLQERTPVFDYPNETLFRNTKIPGLYLLPSGPGALSVSSLLYSDRMNQLVDRLGQQFETILIDTAPMLQFPDARILAGWSDAVVLVFRAGHTDREAAAAAVQRFEEDGTTVLGSVLNDWDPKTTGYDHPLVQYYREGYSARR